MVIKLQKPVKVGEEEITELNLDLDSLTGRDFERAEQMLLQKGLSSEAYNPLSRMFCAALASIAAKVPLDVIRDLPAREYGGIILLVLNFSSGGGLETDGIYEDSV